MDQTPPLNALRAFEAAARNNGFSRAADELFVTQSAISHQVRQLEDWFGVQLFERGGGRARLTPQGEGLARSLGDAFTEIRDACRKVRETAVGEPLNIAVIPSIAACWLIPRMAEFTAENSDFPIRLTYAIHGQPIDFNQTDIAIVYSREKLAVPRARATPLFPGASVPVCSQSLLDWHGPLTGPEQIAGAPLLHDTDWRGWSDWFLKTTGQERRADDGVVFEDFNLMRSAALSGQGVALCPLSIIQDDLKAGRLVALSETTIDEESAYYILEPASLPRTSAPKTRTFKAWLLDAAIN